VKVRSPELLVSSLPSTNPRSRERCWLSGSPASPGVPNRKRSEFSLGSISRAVPPAFEGESLSPEEVVIRCRTVAPTAAGCDGRATVVLTRMIPFLPQIQRIS
jgi:hypothetical protein